MNKKTILQNFMQSRGLNQSKLALDSKVNQGTVSKDLKSPNSLKMTIKYAKKLGLETLDYEGIEHGMYIKGIAKINY